MTRPASTLLAFSVFFLTFLVLSGSGAASVNNCLECHADFEDEGGPAHNFTLDIHYQKGLGCQDCHGGDPALEDMDEVRAVADFRGVPGQLEIPAFCARCHSDAAYMHDRNPSLAVDQLDKYKTSVHGTRLFETGDRKVAQCVSCHTAHSIGDPRMPHSTTHPLNLPGVCGGCHSDREYMAEYKIPTDQLQLYRQSVHGMALFENRDLGAPACNDCHGNHGAAPPGVASLSAVCGQCHAIEAELFKVSPHDEAFTANDFPMCETCHGKHAISHPADQMVGLEEPGICGDCHDRESEPEIAHAIVSMRDMLSNLSESAVAARRELDRAITRGMMTTDEEFLYKDVTQSLINLRAAIHSFDPDSLQPIAEAGLSAADTVRVRSAALIDEYYFRRWGLAISTIFITILAVALWMKIRQIER